MRGLSTPLSSAPSDSKRYKDEEPLLSKLERHVSFNLEDQPSDLQHRTAIRRKRAAKRSHLVGAILLFLGLITYFHISKFHLHRPNHHYPCGGNMAPSDSDPHIQHATFTFDDPDQFTLKELLESNDAFLLDISGNIKIESDLSIQKSAVQVDVDITSQNIEIEESKFDKTATSLDIKTPKLGRKESFWRRPRLIVEVQIHIAKDTKLNNFEVSSRHLSIDISSDLSLAVSDTTKLSTVNGHVNCPTNPGAFHSREKHITTVSGGIKGEYTLEDVLAVQSASGGIRILVIPQKASKSHPDNPAAFSARSISGHIEADFRTSDAPTRNYRVDVHANSGGTSGTYIHGSRTAFSSRSGRISVAVVPFDPSGAGELSSDHVSGGTDIRILSPLTTRKDGTLGALTSSHRSVSGSLNMHYPSEWEGTFEGSSISGHLSAEGSGLKSDITKSPGMKKITGSKGKDGEARLQFNSVSGGIDLYVG